MRHARLGALFLLVFCAIGITFAQSTNSGDIRGTVTDASGALIPDVKVTVLNVDTGVSKEFITNSDGIYDTSSIVTGNYKVTFTKEGFGELVRGPVTLQVGLITVNGELKVGSVSEQVVVNTDVPLLRTETGEQSTTLDSKSMSQLPQAGTNGVTWENFTILLPGASGVPGGSQGSSNPGQVISANGNLPYSNVLADGASTTLSHSQNANPAIFETVSELQVSTSAFSAQYGIGGIVFNQITKGGTNKFHGSAYEYWQNDAMNAYPFEFGVPRAQVGPVPFLRYNNFGGTVGGPVLKKKAFFFFAYDQTMNHGSASNSFNTVPTEAVKGGDFTGQRLIYDPTTQTIGHDAAGNPYPIRKSFLEEYGSNAIPSNLFDAVSSKFQQWYPSPSSHIAGGNFVAGQVNSSGLLQNNFHSSLPQSTPYRKFFGRFDYDITPTNRLTMSDTQSDTPVIYPNSVTACPIGCQSGDVDNNNAQITDVWNISPTLINEARFGYTWQGNFFADLSLGQGYPGQLGWQFAKADTLPAVQFTNTYPYAWIQPSSNAVYKEHIFDPSDVVTLIKGKHILHFGGEVLMYQDNSTAWGNTNAGTLQFSGQYTQQWTIDPATGRASPNGSTGLEYADFLLGDAQNWNASVSPEYGARLKSPQVFVQDDIKLRPNFTLNVGLRYQITKGWSEVKNNMAIFDPAVINPATNTPGAAWFGSTKAHGRDSLQASTFNTFLPRVGFSWLPQPNTTVRGGFGVYAYNWSLDTYGNGMGSEVSSSGSVSDQTGGITPITKFDGTGSTLPYTAASADPTRFNGQDTNYNQYHSPVPKIYQWNFAIQREINTNLVGEVAYVASHGFNLNFPTDLNAIPANHLDTANNTAFRPFTNFGAINGSTNNGISNYHSLQASITQRYSNGLSFNFNYTWAHFLDDQDSSGWGSRMGPQTWQVARNPEANYGNSNFDVRNAFKGNVVYQLPVGHGKMFLNNNRLVDGVLGGWQVSGTMVLQTGQPFTLTTPATDGTYQKAGSQFPDQLNPNTLPANGHRDWRQWYNPAAFTFPGFGKFGNVHRNQVYGPGINVFNLSAGKSFAIRESMNLAIRADATNAFNHPSFGQPSGLSGDNVVGQGYSSNAEQINSTTVGGRNMQLTAKFTF